MAKYQLTDNPDVVIRDNNSHHGDAIPKGSPEWTDYEAWLATGNTPDPAQPPLPPPPQISEETMVLYDHENRLREIEGEPPLSVEDFLKRKSRT